MKRLKESHLSNKDIIERIEQDAHVDIHPICWNCLKEVLDLISDNYENIDVSIKKLWKDAGLYYVTIWAWNEDETQA